MPNIKSSDEVYAISCDETTACELCARSGIDLTRHHLIPRSRHNKARTKRHFDKSDMTKDIAMLCQPCHSQVHRVFDNHELSTYYYTVERLRQHSDIEKFVDWIKKKPATPKVNVRR